MHTRQIAVIRRELKALETYSGKTVEQACGMSINEVIALLIPPMIMTEEDMVVAHCRELIARMVQGEDILPQTAAEIVVDTAMRASRLHGNPRSSGDRENGLFNAIKMLYAGNFAAHILFGLDADEMWKEQLGEYCEMANAAPDAVEAQVKKWYAEQAHTVSSYRRTIQKAILDLREAGLIQDNDKNDKLDEEIWQWED